jgi:undecaprenyl-diphosphatase
VAVVSTRGRSGKLEALSPGAALLVGVLQGAAVLPGVSRSALTIATALALGLTPLAAFRFSFLLSLPAVAGAALLELHDPAVLGRFSGVDWSATVLSFLFGCAALLGLRGLLARGRFWMFSLYLVPLGIAMLAWDVLGGR